MEVKTKKQVKQPEKMIAKNEFGLVMVNVNIRNLENMQVMARGTYIKAEKIFAGTNGCKYYIYSDGSAVQV